MLVGTEEDDHIFGFEGDDILRGIGGTDRLRGEEGDDRLYGGDPGDELTCGPGNDLACAHGDGGAIQISMTIAFDPATNDEVLIDNGFEDGPSVYSLIDVPDRGGIDVLTGAMEPAQSCVRGTHHPDKLDAVGATILTTPTGATGMTGAHFSSRNR